MPTTGPPDGERLRRGLLFGLLISVPIWATLIGGAFLLLYIITK